MYVPVPGKYFRAVSFLHEYRSRPAAEVDNDPVVPFFPVREEALEFAVMWCQYGSGGDEGYHFRIGGKDVQSICVQHRRRGPGFLED